MNALLDRNLAIIKTFEGELSTRISSEKSRKNVLDFLQNAKIRMMKIGECVAEVEQVPEVGLCNGCDLLMEFKENTQALLSCVPAEANSAAISQLPEIFVTAMNKVVAYLGDDSWLQSENTTDAGISFEKQSFSLSMESDVDAGQISGSDRQVDPEILKKSSCKGMTEETLKYPQEYHKLSGEMTLGVLLEPLFDRLFPKNSYIASEKHCRKTTGHSLNSIAAAQLGPDEQGNVLLYKILTDDVLKKIFNDDRIIVLFEQSIHVALLRAVIATALYRLEKMPKKFPKLGGVSFLWILKMRCCRRIIFVKVSFVLLPLLPAPE